MTIISKDLAKAVAILNKGDILAIPTETVYGLAGNIYSTGAISKIFEMKQRPLFNPLIVHIGNTSQLSGIVAEFPEAAQKLAAAFWPGPLTMVLKKQETVPNLVTAGKGTVAVRMPAHPLTLELLNSLQYPLAAPSANPFGSISPTTAQHVENYFGDSLAMVLDGGSCTSGIESTIVGFENGQPVLFRLGSLSVEDIEKVVGTIVIKNKKELAPDAPGMLARHYAPNTTTLLVDNAAEYIKSQSTKKIGLLLFDHEIQWPNVSHVEVLSKAGSLKEAAAKLYAAMHRLDSLQLDLIVVERFPDKGLGRSINDRLERATKKA